MDKNKKKTKKTIKFKVIFLLAIAIISFIYTIQVLNKINLQVDDLFLSNLINSSNHLKGDGLSSNVVKYVVSLDFLNPVNLLENNYKGLVKKKVTPLDNKVVNNDKTDIKTGVTEIKEEKKPIVYIFNTHQSEEYKSNNVSAHNIKPTVLLASYMLQEKLKKEGITSVVEESNVMELLRINNWNYASSYRITKMLLEQAKKDYPSLIYYVDLHRDSIDYNKTTVTINNKKYAKVLFLLGLENANYKENKKVITEMNNIINSKYNGISKGIYEKGGKGVNGVYNQDFSKNCILIEVGGVDNTIDEVSNTIDAIADMLITYIGDNNE